MVLLRCDRYCTMSHKRSQQFKSKVEQNQLLLEKLVFYELIIFPVAAASSPTCAETCRGRWGRCLPPRMSVFGRAEHWPWCQWVPSATTERRQAAILAIYSSCQLESWFLSCSRWFARLGQAYGGRPTRRCSRLWLMFRKLIISWLGHIMGFSFLDASLCLWPYSGFSQFWFPRSNVFISWLLSPSSQEYGQRWDTVITNSDLTILTQDH